MREERDLIEEELKKYPRYAGVAANVVAIREGLDANNLNPNGSTIRWVIREMESKLADGLDQTFRDWSSQTGFQNTIANQELLLQAITQAGQPVTLDGLVFLSEQLQEHLTAKPDRSQMLQARQAEIREIKERNDLIAAECARLVVEKGRPRASLGSATVSPAQALRTRTAEIYAMSLEQLREAKNKRDARLAMRDMPVEELRARVRFDHAASHTPYTRFEPITPRFHFSFAAIGDLGHEWSTELLKKIPSTELAKCLRLFGEEQIQEAIEAANAARR